MSTKVGIVIPFYGGAGYLEKLLNSIFNDSAELDINVYIVDNSKPHERLPISSVKDARVSVINAPAGIGYGKACNIGYKKCVENNKEIMLVVNQDGYFAPGSIQKMVVLLNENTAYTISMPLITQYESLEVEPMIFQVYFAPIRNFITDLFSCSIKSYYDLDLLCGACFALKMNRFKFSFLFDPLFYMYYEDVDLGRRLKNANQLMMLVPAAIFHHTHSNTDPARQTFNDILIKRVSRHIYVLKDPQRSFLRIFINWTVLEIRNLIQCLLQLKFKDLIIEVISVFKTIIKIRKINLSRKTQAVNL